MKSLYFSLFAALIPLTNASAALLTYDFEGLGAVDQFRTGSTNNISGWTQNTANYVADSVEYPYGYIANGTTGKTAVIGTYYATTNPAGPTVLTGDLSSAGSTLRTSQVTLDFSLQSFLANASNNSAIEDNFSITVGGAGGVTAATVLFTADVANGGWSLSSSFGTGGLSGATAIGAGVGYNLSFLFVDNVASIYVGNTLIATGDSSAFSSAALSNIVITQLEQGAPGQNILTFDNVTVNAVPEPTVAALGAIGALGLLRRRRQA